MQGSTKTPVVVMLGVLVLWAALGVCRSQDGGGGASVNKCAYTFNIPGSQLTTQCGSEDLEKAITAVEENYVRLEAENLKLNKELAAMRSGYRTLSETVTAMKKQTDTWRTSINLPGLRPAKLPAGADPSLDVFPSPVAKDCQDAHSKGLRKPGVYTISPQGSEYVIQAYCDDGWTVIQRRFDGAVKFDRYWIDYLSGFGNLSGEYWLGLENIHQLTRPTSYKIRFEAQGWSGKWYFAEYDYFAILGEKDRFKLELGDLSDTNYKDGMSDLNGYSFTTVDRDNDQWRTGNCALYYHGGWWLKNCGMDLNRRWCDGPGCMTFADIIVKKSLMKVKPTGRPKPRTQVPPTVQPPVSGEVVGDGVGEVLI